MRARLLGRAAALLPGRVLAESPELVPAGGRGPAVQAQAPVARRVRNGLDHVRRDRHAGVLLLRVRERERGDVGAVARVGGRDRDVLRASLTPQPRRDCNSGGRVRPPLTMRNAARRKHWEYVILKTIGVCRHYLST